MSQAEFKSTVDVRTIPPRERHPLIFNTFTSLQPGESLLLVNDHDPKPLYYQFQAEHADQFDWNYLEQGPAVWKVRIGKKAA
ncbi:MAG: hemerythrin [Candidatus Muproteobacteria bacterium RIFCSPHIGHO2_02_FULL_65_16]|uniref:Hemerythrin n=1 Tax=Candidatus Muproteobacteria bacterium RIFCSPHIGHO2_02_FULL_65_16 TaxID=1817766 RepID=A0A1F6U244_9PROT|nr:MAG: hemerythrin [Candidatus Muproteobacteria bacterium RIFCSPHIGHO2_02_FULL_65_16]